MVPTPTELEALELDLLLDGIHRHYGYDFRHFAAASFRQRVLKLAKDEKTASISGLLAKLLHDEACMRRCVKSLMGGTVTLFRHPGFYESFRRDVVPLLRTYPSIKIWNAGCSAGEDAYSLAIVLEEEGLEDKSRIYATDMSEKWIEKAKEGVFPTPLLEQGSFNYGLGGGTASLAKYVSKRGGKVKIRQGLKTNIFFAVHNLATDSSFNEFNVIVSRDVLIYFNPRLQERAHALFYESLGMFGVLGMGKQETFRYNASASCYEDVNETEKLFRKVC